MLAWYQARLAARPLLTQSITTGVLFVTGDVVAQQAVEKKGVKGHDLARTGRMALYGSSVFGPVATTWFGFLARNINFRSTAATTIGRVAADQLVFAPVMIGVFLSSMATLEGSSAKAKLDKSYVPALTANWMIWPAVQAFNFTLVPLQHRLLFVNVISIGWNCFLSALNSAK
ncbi:hypothetical protein ACHAQH_002037 [Verticillium albo-atrum]